MVTLTRRERVIRKQLRQDFPHYAERCLQIRTKAGAVTPFALNSVQQRVHREIEAQRQATGRVRAVVLKARQWGCSTYVEGRFYWRVTHQRGLRAFILTHKSEATDNLFQMVDRFHQHCPALVKPHTGQANAKALYFDKLESGYQVGTAGAKDIGRSDTVQLFHGSEVAFWDNAPAHAAGILQTVPDERGTEIILESTANGPGGYFHEMCRAAMTRESPYLFLFVPWFEHGAYRADPPEGWAAPAAWREYGDGLGLDLGQIHWAWGRNETLARAVKASPDEPCYLFRQEYPADATEAFQAPDHESLITPAAVMKARKARVPDQTGRPLVLGVDIARGGRDKTRIIDRQGRCAGYIVDEVFDSDDLMDVAGRIARLIRVKQPAMTFLDVTGLGAGVHDRLVEQGFRVRGVNFGSQAAESDRYANKRAEMWAGLADWLDDPGGADLPDTDEVQLHLTAPGFRFDSSSRLLLEKKEEMVKRVGFSPDLGDALALTFADPVAEPAASGSAMTQDADMDFSVFP